MRLGSGVLAEFLTPAAAEIYVHQAEVYAAKNGLQACASREGKTARVTMYEDLQMPITHAEALKALALQCSGLNAQATLVSNVAG